MNNNTKYWIELAEYDFDTAKAMLQSKRYLYVGFMCHQVIEKMLKAYWSAQSDTPPLKIHSLSRLAEKSGIDKAMNEEQLNFVDILEPLNIEARYPSYKEQLLKSLTPTTCKNIIDETNKLQIWIKSKLSDLLNNTNT
jgi:HEPN domain-containing protein